MLATAPSRTVVQNGASPLAADVDATSSTATLPPMMVAGAAR